MHTCTCYEANYILVVHYRVLCNGRLLTESKYTLWLVEFRIVQKAGDWKCIKSWNEKCTCICRKLRCWKTRGVPSQSHQKTGWTSVSHVSQPWRFSCCPLLLSFIITNVFNMHKVTQKMNQSIVSQPSAEELSGIQIQLTSDGVWNFIVQFSASQCSCFIQHVY